MDDAAPLATLPAGEPSPYCLTPPAAGVKAGPVIFASPHSGRLYPADMLAASRLDKRTIRRSEDAQVDELIACGPGHGHALITAAFARAYLDVNREPWELDPAMFADELPAFARGRTARVAAGLGAIARIVGEGQEIYARKLTFAEAEGRVRSVHQPYHAALADLVATTRARCGLAVLVDWHSMPAAAANHAGATYDIVLGDRYGAACGPAVTRFMEGRLKDLGYKVARNTPYAGGYTTEHYGRPARQIHALQIEINRGLYVDEIELTLTPGFERLRRDIERLSKIMAEADWSGV